MNGSIWSKGGSSQRFCVLVHGGAGSVPEEKWPLHTDGCTRAARRAAEIVRQGGSALDAVCEAVRELEEDPVFNAGKGACFNAEGHIELDASVMEGTRLGAGAVGALSGFASPISIARTALEEGTHVMYVAEGARAFALEKGFEAVAEDALSTPAAREAFEELRNKAEVVSWAGGTVGAVVRDERGRLAAATSTGGMINKRAGRIGDSAIIGAGTYADDEAGAISTTGNGEGFIRFGGARIATAWMSNGQSAEGAARRMIERLRDRFRVNGGAAAIDREGRWGLSRSTATMSWALISSESEFGGI